MIAAAKSRTCAAKLRLAVAFTLTELLVVMAIISILAALLFPSLKMAWRRAQVLACPIAYVAEDSTIWLCDAWGTRRLQVCSLKTGRIPEWSPSGYRLLSTTAAGDYPVVINAVTGAYRVYATRFLECVAWVDDDTIQGFDWMTGNVYRVNLNTGAFTIWNHNPARTIACHYPGLVGGWLVAEDEGLWSPQLDIVVRDDTWKLVRTIWSDPDNNNVDFDARADFVGEYVAWNRAPGAGNISSTPKKVALKRLDDSPDEPPTLLDAGFSTIGFCDWTADGNILAVVPSGGRWQLAIISRENRLVRIIPKAYAVTSESCASYRREARYR